MFRFASKRMPLLPVAASLARYQSSAVPSTSGGGARNTNRRRNLRPTQSLPRFEVHDVRDEAAQGSMTRVSVDGKQLLLSQFPQLGPRKADPNDAAPQFDTDRRISLRFRHLDLAAMVCVVEGRLERHHMANTAYELDFEKTASGYVFKGQVHRVATQTKEEWSVRFENQLAVTLEHFLQSSLTESFGFLRHQHAMAAQDSNGAANGAQNQNQNRNNNNNNNRNNRRRNNRNESSSKPEPVNATEAAN